MSSAPSPNVPSLRRSLAFSLFGKYCLLTLQILVTMVLSRLLTPRDIGIVAIGMAVVGLAHTLRDFGVSAYLIQEKELTEERLRSTFGMALLVSWVIAALLAVSSAPAASLYDEPGVRAVILVLSLNFLILPFGSMVTVLMQREMDFASVYKVNVICGFIHAASVVTLAASGMGFIAIPWASVINNSAGVILAYVFRPSHLRLRPSFREWRRVARYGVVAACANLVGVIGAQAPDLIIGRLLGLVETGLFSKAQGLMTVFNENVMAAITPVATSKFAATHRAGDTLKAEFLDFICHSTAVAWPFFSYSGLMMFYVIHVLFGWQWDAAIVPAQILCIAAIVTALANMNGPIFMATGAAGSNLRTQVTTQAAKIALVLVGAPWGLTGIAWAMVLLSVFFVYVSFSHARREIEFSIGDIVNATKGSFGLALICTIPAAVVLLTVGNSAPHTYLVFCLGSAAALATWLAGLFLLKHPLRREIVSASHAAIESLAEWRWGRPAEKTEAR